MTIDSANRATEPLPDSLWGLVEYAAARWPDALMLVSRQGDQCSFSGFRERAEIMAAGLAARGIGAGDVVSWILPTWVDTVVLSAALARLGAVQNPIIAIYRDREVDFCCREAGSRFLLTPGVFGGFDFGAMGARIAARLDGLRHLVVSPGAFPSGDLATLAPARPGMPGETRWLLYTSGTTADPKGARHADQTVGAYSSPLIQRLDLQPGDRYALVFPYPHVGGIGLCFAALRSGCTHLLDETVDPIESVRFLSERSCTHAGTGVPFFRMYLAAQERQTTPIFPALKVCPSGGAPTPPAIHRRLVAELGGVGVASGWGLTEAPVLTNSDIRDPDDKLASTVGRAMPGVELIVVAPDGSRCPSGIEGELRAKGPQVMLGHVHAALDAEAFDAEGFFRTGDLGLIDADGYVEITGRLKDVIIRNGENVSAREVEDLLFTHPEIADAAVVGLPDERTGERVCAVVVPVEGAAPTLDAIVAHLKAAGLRNQALPERLERLAALPRNPAGKVRKRELQDRFR